MDLFISLASLGICSEQSFKSQGIIETDVDIDVDFDIYVDYYLFCQLK